MKRIIGALLVVASCLAAINLVVDAHRVFTVGTTHDVEVWVPTAAWIVLFLGIGLHLIKAKKTNLPESGGETIDSNSK